MKGDGEMGLLTKEELKVLSDQNQEFCISIFMPTYRMGAETTQGRIRLKNLLRDAKESLIAVGLRNQAAGRLLKPLTRFVDHSPFWQYQSDGLAIFLTDGFLHYYRVPLVFDELVVVAKRFHLKPLLPLLFNDGQFYVLALSQNRFRLFECTHYSVCEVELEGVPQNLDEAVRVDEPKKQRHLHTAAGTAIFHGHGGGIDDTKNQLLQYFRQIDRGISQCLKNENAPLVLAGVDYLFPIYREANTYDYLLDVGINGNPDEQKPEELQTKAWELVVPQFMKQRDEALARYRQLIGSGRTSNDVTTVVEAAFLGRVELLFVGVGIQRWGRFDQKNGRAEIHAEAQTGDEDLLDWAAIQTIRNGGAVFASSPSEVPDGMALSAVFRF
jgi:hypothetical protein